MILTINAGSSSIKFQLYKKIKKGEYKVIIKGLLERIGLKTGGFSATYKNKKYQETVSFANHELAAKYLISFLLDEEIIVDHNQITGVGHRIVNGGDRFLQSTLITPETLATLKKNVELAPLHNPPATTTIEAFQSVISAPAVAICDTSFHSTIPAENYLYPVPYEWYVNYKVRRYGMHGINYRYIVGQVATLTNKDPKNLNLILCHLGNGASVCGIKNGQSVITSMGLTPLEGLMMGTRSGDIDPALVEYVGNKMNISYTKFVELLNKKSGLLGISGVSADARDVENAMTKGNKRAKLAIDMFVARVCKYISYYQNEVSRDLDMLVFSGGIGENSAHFRQAIIDKLNTLDLVIDEQLNNAQYDTYKTIHTTNSEVPIYVIRANEEIVMCRDVDDIVSNLKK